VRPGAPHSCAIARRRRRSRGSRARAPGSGAPRAPRNPRASPVGCLRVPCDAAGALSLRHARRRPGPWAATVHEAATGPVERDIRSLFKRNGLVTAAAVHPLIRVRAVDGALFVGYRVRAVDNAGRSVHVASLARLGPGPWSPLERGTLVPSCPGALSPLVPRLVPASNGDRSGVVPGVGPRSPLEAWSPRIGDQD